MGIPGSANPLLLATAAGAAGGYQIERSLRFNSADSAYLSRTPASAGNRKTWTWAGWVKRGKLGTYQTIISAGNSSPSQRGGIRFPTGDTLEITEDSSGYTLTTTQVFRDVSAWYHLVVAFDSTQATSSNRIKLYVNGTQVSTFSTATYPSQNFDSVFSTTDPHRIGELSYAGNIYELDAYLADLHFCDGTAYDASAFGEFDTNGIWQPKAFSGSYGSQGWKLDFSDNSAATATTLGKDSSGNGNNWTPNNLSVTAGAGNDSLVDTPTNYGTDTGAGGEVRGNYCTLNPLAGTSTVASYIKNGNLEFDTAYVGPFNGTIGVVSGKFYWEFTAVLGSNFVVGVGDGVGRILTSANFICKFNPSSIDTSNIKSTVTLNTYSGAASGDVFGFALDMDSGTLDVYQNNSKVLAFDSFLIDGPLFFMADRSASASPFPVHVLNFGQRPFAYTAPSGFKALCTTNLPAPTIENGSDYFDTKLYTGNGSTQTISGLGFSPDLIWIKRRDTTSQHVLTDIVRGNDKQLFSSLTNAEQTSSTAITAFNSDGFSLGANPSPTGDVNGPSGTFAAWAWDAGSSTVTNNDGSISSQVRANPSAGFSVVTYTGTSSTQSVGHGLGVAPALVITKNRAVGNAWGVYHSALGVNKYLVLSATSAADTATGVWGSVTSTVFGIGNFAINGQSNGHVAYCFASVEGYSAFGTYTGNSSTDGQFVYTGFRPRWVLCKSATTAQVWNLYDTARNEYNLTDLRLFPNLSNAEALSTTNWIDILSNGFRLRGENAVTNANNQTYIYAAFAENPFALARAR